MLPQNNSGPAAPKSLPVHQDRHMQQLPVMVSHRLQPVAGGFGLLPPERTVRLGFIACSTSKLQSMYWLKILLKVLPSMLKA